jgi:hypothetical protein
VNWRNETWRKLYIREEGSFASLSYSARALAGQLLKHCDGTGRLYARRGEDIKDAICFRVGANRGERRFVRPAVDELLADGYLVAQDGYVRIRNFTRVHGGGLEGEEVLSGPAPMDAHEAAANLQRTSDEPVTNEQRTSDEPVTNGPRPCNEESGKRLESRAIGADVPSVPFLPSVPSEEEEESAPPPPAPTPAPAPVPAPRPPGWKAPPVNPGPLRPGGVNASAWDARRILDTYGTIRAEIIPGAIGWHVAGTKLFEKAGQLAEAIANGKDPEAAEADIEETMRRFLKRSLEPGQDPRDQQVNWGFSTWLSQFTDLREQLKGRLTPTASGNKPCDFHTGSRNSGRKAAKHEWRSACPECRHLDARAGPRPPASRPESTAELLGGG